MEKTDEFYGAGNEYTTEFRQYDSRLGRWLSLDPLMNKYPDQSPYISFNNNPLYFVDPKGLEGEKEYPNKAAYLAENPNGKLDGSDGHWLTSDRENNTSVWNSANAYNLQQPEGNKEYTLIVQRADFYNWFQSATDKKGFELKWPGAAGEVAHAVNLLTNYWVRFSGFSNESAVNFANAGNKIIFNDVFSKLREAYNGAPLKGKEAYNWDANALSQEQNLIQPLYDFSPAKALISASAKQLFLGSSVG